MQHKRHFARTCSLVALVLATGTGHVHASAIALPTGNPSTGIYTPAQVVEALTHQRHAWVGRTVRVALPVESMDWGRGSSYGLGAYQLSVQLPALPHGVNESGEPFDVVVSDQQMRAARHAARAWHGPIPLGATAVLTVRLLGRDTPIGDLPLVADATYRGSARQLAPVAALCPTDVCLTDV